MYYKTYRGSRLDLQFYVGKATIDFEVQVFNDDETEANLGVYDDIKFKMFHKIHGTEVLELSMDDGGLQVDSPIASSVFINLSDSEDLRPKEYWYECYGIREDDEQELIFFGVGQAI